MFIKGPHSKFLIKSEENLGTSILFMISKNDLQLNSKEIIDSFIE